MVIILQEFQYGIGWSKNELIAWLEKQGEQKSINKVKPKFKVGDWIVYDGINSAAKIINIDAVSYEAEFFDGKRLCSDIEYVDENFRLWSIEDAKDGDVLVTKKGVIFINDDSRKEKATLGCYCFLSIQYEFYINEHKTDSWLYKEGVKPATKEQRDFFFAKMKKADYELDAEKKELIDKSKVD